MNIPATLRYTNDHEWARLDADGLICTGITDFAQGELGDIVYVDITALNQSLAAGDAFGSVDAVKAASDLYMPLAGTIVEINDALAAQPDLVNQDPYGAGWMVKIRPAHATDYDALLSPDDYASLTGAA